jgi:hypothetical protein
MKNLIIILFIGVLFSGCSLLNPGYLNSKPEIEKMIPYKTTLSDVEDTLGTPAISQIEFGNQIKYKYFYNTPNASVDTSLMIKGNYSEGCKDCGQIIATFAWKGGVGDYKQFLLRGLAVSDKRIESEVSHACALLAEKKFEEAYPILLKAAEGHSSLAQQTVGLMYVNGDGVERDYIKAAHWFARASGADYPPALYDLGAIYRNGEGVAVDVNTAIYFYTKSANFGYPMAMTELIKIHKAIGDQKQVEYWTKRYESISKNKR